MIDSIKKTNGKYMVTDHVTRVSYPCKSKKEAEEKVAELEAKYSKPSDQDDQEPAKEGENETNDKP